MAEDILLKIIEGRELLIKILNERILELEEIVNRKEIKIRRLQDEINRRHEENNNSTT